MRPGSRDPRPPTRRPTPPAARAEALIDDDRLLEAARVCRDAGLSTPLDIPGADFPVERETVRKVNHYLPKAARMHALLDSLKSDPNAPDTEWLVQGEHMGRRDVSIYYRVDPETSSKLTACIESPISRDMLVPLLSVLNESELYKSVGFPTGPSRDSACAAATNCISTDDARRWS